MPDSSESLVHRSIRDSNQNIADLTRAPIHDLVEDPKLMEAAGKIITYRKHQNIRTLENCGTVPVYWKIGSPPSAGVFGGVLKACLTNDDGNGGFIDLSRIPGDVYIAPVTGSTCRVVANVSVGIEGL